MPPDRSPTESNSPAVRDFGQDALDLHRECGGKIEIALKVPLNDTQDLSLAYTPGVARVCQEIAKDRAVAWECTIKGNTVAVVTDGSAVLGLGNIGAEAALPVMEGKAALLKRFGGVDAFPICIRSQETQAIIELVRNISPVFGGVNLEDIAAPKCFEVEDALQDIGIPVFHDDQWGTAIVVLAGLINAAQVVGKDLRSLKVAISGAGAAGTAVARLLLGMDGWEKVADSQVYDLVLVDSQGVIWEGRPDLGEYKETLARLTNRGRRKGGLAEAMAGMDVFIGLSRAELVSQEMVESMNRDAIVFAMANPIPEIWPALAKEAGAKVAGTGRSDLENQINNVLAFPGVFRGALDVRAPQITFAMKMAAAAALAQCVPEPSVNYILPSPFEDPAHQCVAAAVRDAATVGQR